MIAPVTINGKEATLAVDSWADISVLPEELANSLSLQIHPCSKKLQPAGDSNVMLITGRVTIATFCIGDRTLNNVQMYIGDIKKAAAPAQGILGLDLFPRLGIGITGVPIDFPNRRRHEDNDDCIQDSHEDDWLNKYQAEPELREQLMKIIAPFIEINEAIPASSFCTHPSSVVQLHTGEASPVYVPQYRVSDHMAKWIDDQVDKWEADGVVCDAPTDAQWNSPLLAALDRAARAKGKDPRVCIDPRKINALLASDPRSLPDVRDIHKKLQGFKYITEIDLRKGFNQFTIAEEDQVKTTFTWKGRKRMFRGAPFGLKPLSQVFQGVIEQILHEVRDFATPFIDNIYVHTNTTMEDHADQVSQILQILNKWNLRINRTKCFFGYTAVNVLGHLVSGNTKQPDPAKKLTALEWPTPRTGKDIERFLGFTNYLRDHIPHYAHLAAPLEANRKVKKLSWTMQLHKSFSKLKAAIQSAPVLHAPLPGVEFCIATDASQSGVGWALYQVDPVTSKERYILFGAKALNKSQRNYGATRRELLAIVTALPACLMYIHGQHFRLYTDHKALTYMFTQKHMNYMLLNWMDILFDYDFTVIHRPGIQMILPDALSRLFTDDAEEGCGSRLAAIKLSEKVNFPDRELRDFIQQRFAKKFAEADKRLGLLQQHHELGHFGAEALFSSLWHAGFYWPNMRADCDLHVAACLQCLRFNVGKSGFHTRQFIHAELPFDHVSIDLVSGLPTTERGNNYTLVITDICTRYKLLVAQQTKSAVETARNLWSVFCTFPIPKILQSDNGTEFVNSVVKEMLQLQGVEHRTIAAYNPRANGTAENSVGNSYKVLLKLLNGDMTDWDLRLPSVQLALNSKPNRSTKTSPASLLFGMDINAFANYDKATSKLLTVHQLMQRQKIIGDLVRPTANSNFKAAQTKRTASANKRIRQTPPLQVGTLVMLKDPTRTTKNQPLWIGPYRVVRQKKGGNYVLQCTDHSLYHREPPRDHLKVIDGKADVNLDDIYYVEKIVDHKVRICNYRYRSRVKVGSANTN